jgi:hypothetical protein
MPVVGSVNLKAVWNKALTKGAFIRDEATAIGQAQSKSGVAITSVLVKKEDGGKPSYTPMHLLRNDKLKRTIIIGDEAIDDELYNRLKRSNIIYINRDHEMGAQPDSVRAPDHGRSRIGRRCKGRLPLA